MPHALNFVAGWYLLLAAFLSGAVIGLWFHQRGFLGGYDSFRRRLVRLGHIALAALGLLNLVYGLAPATATGATALWAPRLLVVGGIAMPLVCFLAAWRRPFRHLFFIPVSLLTVAVVLIISQVQP